jgi:hypothetical protein
MCKKGSVSSIRLAGSAVGARLYCWPAPTSATDELRFRDADSWLGLTYAPYPRPVVLKQFQMLVNKS